MPQVNFYKFQSPISNLKKALHWLFECILPCSIAFVAFQYIAYCYPTMIVQTAHVKGIDLSSPFDRQIPLLAGFILVYAPSVITWIFMPYVIYGLYGRKHFFKFFSVSIIFSTVCFIIYILFPTEARLQRDEISNGGTWIPTLANGNIFDKLLLKTYIAAAPYGEAPSGHWGKSLIIMLGLIKPKQQKKYTKVGLTTFILWAMFGVSVCLATMFLKQHNLIDGAITIIVVIAIRYLVINTKIAAKLEWFFTFINVKLGITASPNKNMKTIKYDSNKPWQYQTKFIFTWILFGVVIIWLLLAAWNCSLGGFTGLKVPSYIIPTYHVSYTQDPNSGMYIPWVKDDWKEFLWS